MDDQSIEIIVAEIAPLLNGRGPGKIFQLGPASFAIDFGLRDQGYLFLNAEPATAGLYLIKRRARDLEKQSLHLAPFAQTLRKELSQTQLQSVEKDRSDRLVRFKFAGIDELGQKKSADLIAQLTGRSANLLLLDREQRIIQRARPTKVPGQQPGEIYRAPAEPNEAPPPARTSKLHEHLRGRPASLSLSEAADAYFTSLHQQKTLADQAAAARASLRKKITQQERLLHQLQQDLASHVNPDQEKRLGDLLLANLSTAQRVGNRVVIIDYFADGAPTIEIELDESLTLAEEASRRFALYALSKRAISQIRTRMAEVTGRLRESRAEQESLEKELASGQQLAAPLKSVPLASAGGSRKPVQKIPGVRRYLSSDGLEILVGRTARDNDHLTFKIARPSDLWLHAADYGGSHVVVRNSNKKGVPHRTLIEAAQLAAWFSQARKDAKVDVHHTERKFVAKLKGANPGLVRMQRFKNITVAPKEAGSRQ